MTSTGMALFVIKMQRKKGNNSWLVRLDIASVQTFHIRRTFSIPKTVQTETVNNVMHIFFHVWFTYIS